MAGYYSHYVVQPSLPSRLEYDAHQPVLDELGYTFEKARDGWYVRRQGREQHGLGHRPQRLAGGVRRVLTAGCGTSCLDVEARRADPSGYRRGPGLGRHDWLRLGSGLDRGFAMRGGHFPDHGPEACER